MSSEQSVMVSAIVYVLMVFVVRDCLWAAELINYGGSTGELTTISGLIIFLILLKIGWIVSTCVSTTSVKSFLDQAIPLNPNAPYMSIIR